MSCKEFFTTPVIKPVMLSVGLLCFQQFCGINAVLFNAADLFSKAGLSDAKLASLPLTAVQLIGNVIACLLVDRIGRCIPLWTAALGMAGSLTGLGVYFEIYETVSGISWLSIFCSVLFCFFYSLAWGPIPWIVMAEIIPPQSPRTGHWYFHCCMLGNAVSCYKDLRHTWWRVWGSRRLLVLCGAVLLCGCICCSSCTRNKGKITRRDRVKLPSLTMI